MARNALNRSRRRLTPTELELARSTGRWSTEAVICTTGCAGMTVPARRFVTPRRPATRRPWANRVSRSRVLPAGGDGMR